MVDPDTFKTYLYGYYDWIHGTWNTLWNQMSDLVLKAKKKKLLTIEKDLFFGLKSSCIFSTSQLYTGFSVFMNK